jgi:hypothetical protein
MRLPRVRFTVRQMMVAVAVVAMLFGGVQGMKRRQERLSSLARHHGVKMLEGGSLSMVLSQEHGRYFFAKRVWHERMHRKYRLAAARPWRHVEPDPPEPK